MKIIAFGDVHMATSTLLEISGLTAADCVIVTGDLTNFGNTSDAKEVLNHILKFNKKLLCVAGNLDNKDVNDYLEKLGMNLHGQAHILKRKACVYGVGGSNRTPFDTPWEFSEEQLTALVHEAHQQARELIELNRPLVGYSVPTIFVSHVPPFGCKLDRLLSGKHVGSKAIRSFIDSNQPDLCITSHIHESRGEEFLGRTLVVNTGMLAAGGWVEITVDGTTIEATLS